MTVTTSPWLSGAFAPVQEEVTVTDLPVSGRLPGSLDGRYLRNGPNPLGAVDPATYNFFAGDGMVHGVRLRDGRAEWYRNRWIRSTGVADALGEPRPSDAGRDRFDFPNNTNVVGHAGRYFALQEGGPRPFELTGDLDPVGPCDFDGTLPNGSTAHPHRDPASGEIHAVLYDVTGREDRVQYVVQATDGRIRRCVEVEVPGRPIMHDFALTRRHVVLLDLPVTYTSPDVPDVARIAYGWNPDHPARLGLLPRDGAGSDVRWFDLEPCYVFHVLNAYEEGDRLVVDVVRYPTMFATTSQGPDAISTLDRWTVDLAAGTVGETRLDDHFQELPRLDERRTGRQHRYGYAAGLDGSVLRHDLVAGSTTARRFEPGDVPGEHVFVPATDDSSEDDGWLLGFVYRAATDRSDLNVLDAATLETMATVHLPVRVPFGFHGNWIPAG